MTSPDDATFTQRLHDDTGAVHLVYAAGSGALLVLVAVLLGAVGVKSSETGASDR